MPWPCQCNAVQSTCECHSEQKVCDKRLHESVYLHGRLSFLIYYWKGIYRLLGMGRSGEDIDRVSCDANIPFC